MTENKIHVAYGAVASAPETSEVKPFAKDNVTLTESTADGTNKKLKSLVMTGIPDNIFNSITQGAKSIGCIILTQLKSQ